MSLVENFINNSMIKMDKKAQISAEFLLLMGFILLVVLVFASFIGDQNEVNTVIASAKQGASEALSGMVFINRTVAPVRVSTITVTGDTDKNIQIRLSRAVPDNYKEMVRQSALKSINASGFTRVNDNIITNRYNFTVTILP